MIHITCRDETGCRTDADKYILFGCKNMHTFEMALCQHHLNLRMSRTQRCRICEAHILDGYACNTKDILDEYKNWYRQLETHGPLYTQYAQKNFTKI
jgi:hypothetical protein